MDEQTILSAIVRLEGLATKYGPTVTSIVSTVADNLGGPDGPRSDNASLNTAAPPVASHLGTRLHGVAALLEGLFGSVEGHAKRAASAIGAGG